MALVLKDTARASKLVSNVLLVLLALAVIWVVADMRAQNATMAGMIASRDAAAARPRSPKIGDDVAPITLRSLNGETMGNLRDLSGEVMVVTFFTTTCPFCERSLPTWAALAPRVEEEGVDFVGISLDEPTLASAYAEKHSINWPIWVVVNRSEPSDLFDVRVVPLTLILHSGMVTATYVGEFQKDRSQVLLEELHALLE